MVMVMMMMIKHEYKRGTVLGASVEGVERVLEVNRFEEHSTFYSTNEIIYNWY
jgi:hypothetical protein